MNTTRNGVTAPRQGTPALLATRIVQPLATAALALLALSLVTVTLLCAFGVLPWPELALAWNGAPVEGAGMWALIGLTVLAIGLCSFVPSNGRIMALETSHRNFHISMHDVAHAYHKAHAADREGVFRMSHEFDAVRERIAFLRDHPDLDGLEPEILEAAAQMSQVSHELASIYSEEKVNRARTFLKQRQEEIEQFNDRLDTAKAITNDLRRWLDAVEMEESIARSQLDRMLAELDDLLPELGMGVAAAVQKDVQQDRKPRAVPTPVPAAPVVAAPAPARVRRKEAERVTSLADAMKLSGYELDSYEDEHADAEDFPPLTGQQRLNVIGMTKPAAE
ncbi:DNA repair protein [Oceanicola sp. 22II-s10i]|uniref:DNA repair protein n=1 Tax=Oceanicola sp. 22II-s10i TaxID=1317116 RepID=UPI0015956FC7|nr:DNA repair protein [Oceanicola sp. 22II-s10i]